MQYKDTLTLYPDKIHTLSLRSVNYKDDLDRQLGSKTGKMNKDGIVVDEEEIDKVRGDG